MSVQAIGDHIKGAYAFVCFIVGVAFLFGPTFFVTAASAAFHGTTWTEEQTLIAQRAAPLVAMCALMAFQIAMLAFCFVSENGPSMAVALAACNGIMYPLSWIIYVITPLGWLVYCCLPWLVMPLWFFGGLIYYGDKQSSGAIICTIVHYGMCAMFYNVFTS